VPGHAARGGHGQGHCLLREGDKAAPVLPWGFLLLLLGAAMCWERRERGSCAPSSVHLVPNATLLPLS